jgi:hypothetical protein
MRQPIVCFHQLYTEAFAVSEGRQRVDSVISPAGFELALSATSGHPLTLLNLLRSGLSPGKP